MFVLHIHEIDNDQKEVFTWIHDNENMLEKIASDINRYSDTYGAVVNNINPDTISNRIMVFDESHKCINIFKCFDDMDRITLSGIYNKFTPLTTEQSTYN